MAETERGQGKEDLGEKTRSSALTTFNLWQQRDIQAEMLGVQSKMWDRMESLEASII